MASRPTSLSRRWFAGAIVCAAAICITWIAFILLFSKAPPPSGPKLPEIAAIPEVPEPDNLPPLPGFEPNHQYNFQFPTPAETLVNTAPQYIAALCPDRAGTMWFGSEGAELYRFDPRASESQRWTHFTDKNGLGDNFVYALATDRQGRLWVGHLHHGLSVFNGEKWQNYEVVAGLTRPDSLAGPLGERIFRIVISPHDGDVWIATNCGLTRYSPASDSWSYFTTTDGLPSNQATALAFAPDSTLYLATQCDGIAIASPSDNYKSWRSITAEKTNPELKNPNPGTPLPTSPSGPGLPTNMINDILVGRDGTIYAATTAGVAWSADKGNTWQFTRGSDYVGKVQARLGGPPENWSAPDAALIFEDYSTCLAEDPAGNILVGHRAHRSQLLRPRLTESFIAENADVESVQSILALPTGTFTASFGTGASFYGTSLFRSLPVHVPTPTAPLPASAAPPTAQALAELLQKTPARSTAPGTITYLGQEWMTQGDWMGRYGRQLGILCAASSPSDHIITQNIPGYSITKALGPAAPPNDGVRHWLRGYQTEDPRGLWNPFVGYRRQSEWVDNGQALPVEMDGPDLNVRVKVPAGLHRVSLYLVNPDAHKTNNRMRDFLVEIKPFLDDKIAMYKQPASVRTRAVHFWGGLYQQFLFAGPTDQSIIIHRNYSKNAHLSGIFIDALVMDNPTQPTNERSVMQMSGNLSYRPPNAPAIADPSPTLQAALQLWQRIGGFPASAAGTAGERATAILAYRAAAAEKAPDDLLALWRWQLPLWSSADRQSAHKFFLDAWWSHLKLNPQLMQQRNVRLPEGVTPPPAPIRRTSLESYLNQFGQSLPIRFTLEGNRNITSRAIVVPATPPKSLDEIKEYLAKEAPEVVFLASPVNPNIIHVIEKTLLDDPTYPLNRSQSLTFTGGPVALIDRLDALTDGRITKTPPQGSRGGSLIDDTNIILHVDARDQPLRELLSAGLTNESFAPVAVLAVARKNGEQWTVSVLNYFSPPVLAARRAAAATQGRGPGRATTLPRPQPTNLP